MVSRERLETAQEGLRDLTHSLTAIHTILQHTDARTKDIPTNRHRSRIDLEKAIFGIEFLRGVPIPAHINPEINKNWRHFVRTSLPERARRTQEWFNSGYSLDNFTTIQYNQTRTHRAAINELFAPNAALGLYDQERVLVQYTADLIQLHPPLPFRENLFHTLSHQITRFARNVANGGIRYW